MARSFALTVFCCTTGTVYLMTAGSPTINDNSPDSLRLNQFMVSLLFGWNKIIEGDKRPKHKDKN